MSKVTVSVPGSTSNLGSGFDTLGIAISLRNNITLSVSDRTDGPIARIVSSIPESVREDAEGMLSGACQVFQQKSGTELKKVDVFIEGDVPVARGLGSSVTLRLGIIAGLSAINKCGLPASIMGEWVSEIEGHPDNAMPSAIGGFCAAGLNSDGKLDYAKFELPENYTFVTLIPDFEVKTDESRRSLPDSYCRSDVVRGINRSTMVATLLATKQLDKLKGFFDDPIHQPYRGKLIPGFDACMEAGKSAGAHGGWISGSGSTLMWLATENVKQIGSAVQEVMPNAQLLNLKTDNLGLTILEQNNPDTTLTP